MTIKPFHFRLKKISSQEMALLRAIYEYLPATGLKDSFRSGIEETIARHLGEDFSFGLDAVHQEDYSTFLSKLPKSTVMAVLGLTPLRPQAILEIDMPLALLAVERLMGSLGGTPPEPRALTDTEEGVLQYLLLQILSHIHTRCGKDARVHFRLDRFAFQAHEVRDIAKGDDGVAVLIFRVVIGQHTGFIRLVFPNPFVEEGLLNVESPAEARPAEREFRLKNLRRFGYIRTPLWAEIGRTLVIAHDIAQLEKGDVIILDHSDVKLAKGRPSGSVVLRVGEGLHGGIDSVLQVSAKHVSCRITQVHKGD